MRDDREKLLDILEAVERIEKYAVRGRETFEREELIQTWVLRHLQIIGEAARSLSIALRDHHSEIPWSDIIGMRNVLVHDYFGIDTEIVWNIVEHDLPKLKEQIKRII